MRFLNPILLILITLQITSAKAEIRTERLACSFIMRNQGDTSTCWMHSALQMMEQVANTPLSIDAILIPEVRSRAIDRYLGHNTPWDGGAGPTRPFALALEHGLVPEAIWKRGSIIVANYENIFSKIETLLENNYTQEEYMQRVDHIIREYTYDLPPKNFIWSGRNISAQEYARSVIGPGTSMGYDFRPVNYDEKLYGRMPEIPWTTIVSSNNQKLIKITDIIEKEVVHLTADEALNKLVEIFHEGRPVALTFIWADQNGEKVLGLNAKKEYVAIRPSAEDTYTSSHLVLVTGLVWEEDQIKAIEVLDPLAKDLESGFRIITKEFFKTHGKTVHEISTNCNQILSK